MYDEEKVTVDRENLRTAVWTIDVSMSVVKLAMKRAEERMDFAYAHALALVMHQLDMTADDLRTAAESGLPERRKGGAAE